MADSVNGNGQRLKAAEWQGYMKARMEDVCRELGEVKDELAGLRRSLTNLRVQVAGIAATVSLLFMLAKEFLIK